MVQIRCELVSVSFWVPPSGLRWPNPTAAGETLLREVRPGIEDCWSGLGKAADHTADWTMDRTGGPQRPLPAYPAPCDINPLLSTL